MRLFNLEIFIEEVCNIRCNITNDVMLMLIEAKTMSSPSYSCVITRPYPVVAGNARLTVEEEVTVGGDL